MLRTLFTLSGRSRRNARGQLALIRSERADAAAAAAYVTAQRGPEHHVAARRLDARDRPPTERRPDRERKPLEPAPALWLVDAPAGPRLP